MSIFDDKEEVINLQLTKLGKQKLALGQFMPEYYSFDDDDILYDSQYVSLTASSEEVETRLLEETVYTKPQTIVAGVETEYKKNVANLREGEYVTFNQSEVERTYNSNSSLGNSKYSSVYAPAWALELYAGDILSASPVISGAVAPVRIPQINLKDNIYPINVFKGISEELFEEISFQGFEGTVLENDIEEFDDGTIVEVVNQDIFIDLEEINSMFKNDNFDIEVFMVEEKDTNVTSGGNTTYKQEELIPLYFKQKPFVRDDIYDDEEFFNAFEDNNITPENVEYYLVIEVDDEIPLEALCRYVPESRRQGIYGSYRKCSDTQISIPRGIYRTDVTRPDLADDCDD